MGDELIASAHVCAQRSGLHGLPNNASLNARCFEVSEKSNIRHPPYKPSDRFAEVSAQL